MVLASEEDEEGSMEPEGFETARKVLVEQGRKSSLPTAESRERFRIFAFL
jgi:hypothetical protein